ncbi:hypothetical protein [Paenibacillus sp. GXUN7292]|uniref:hypothetical protein n=1 Tax=Paenibacillus sp. GXUN7292 TaxID=3422499 RepID=UPI003D7EA159
MANQDVELIYGYEQWIAIVQDQLALAGQERIEEHFDQINQLELEKEKIKQTVMEHSEQLDKLLPDHVSKVLEYITTIQGLNDRLQHLLEGWYGLASSSMKQVSAQRRILNSYGGVQNSDIVSYYIDSKN